MFEGESDDEIPSYRTLPIYIKSTEIFELTNKIVEYINDAIEKRSDDAKMKMAEFYVKDLLENAIIIPAKIAGATGAGLYDLKMENAAIIRKAGREISTTCSGLKMLNIDGLEYLNLLKDEIEVFRVTFAEWVKTFDTSDYIIDRWGLFNPPGVNYDDVDPDDLAYWRLSSRAAVQNRKLSELQARINEAEQYLLDAPRQFIGGVAVADLGYREGLEEVSEASARLGIPFVYIENDREGRFKKGIKGAPKHVIEQWLSACDLPHKYGCPVRGYAGAYSQEVSAMFD